MDGEDGSLGGVIRTWNYLVSGRSSRDCAVVTSRYDDVAGFHPGYGEAWIVGVQPLGADEYTYDLERGFDHRVTGLWLSPNDTCFATTGEGIHRNPRFFEDDAASHWIDEPFDESMKGVIGLSDDEALAWGTRGADRRSVYRFDGARWRAIASPDFFVRAMHAASPSLVWAVGEGGRAARFDGARWTEVTSRWREPLNDVYVVSRDEVYAVGAWGGIYEGSAFGWSKVAQLPDNEAGSATPLYAVAYWKDTLWIGAGIGGLWRRDGHTHRTELVHEGIRAMCFDARERLIMATEHDVTETVDGVAFTRSAVDMVAEARGDRELTRW